MSNLLDLIASDESPSDISDKIKEILYSKATEKIEQIRPEVSASMFNSILSAEEWFQSLMILLIDK